MLLNLLTILVCVLCWSACDKRSYHKQSSDNHGQDSTAYSQIEDFDPSDIACQYLLKFPSSIENLMNNPRRWMSGDDACVLMLLDSLAAHVNDSDGRRYIRTLAMISRLSDGYIAEAMCLIASDLFKDQNSLFNIMQFFRHHHDTALVNAFWQDIVSCIAFEISYNPGYISVGDVKKSIRTAMISAKDNTDSLLIQRMEDEILSTH